MVIGRLTWITPLLAVAVLLLNSSGAGASPTSNSKVKYGSGFGVETTYTSSNGCSTLSTTAPTFKLPSATIRMAAASRSSTCSAAQGGVLVESDASTELMAGVGVFVNLTHTVHQINFTYSLRIAASDFATGNVSTCPTSISHVVEKRTRNGSSTTVWINSSYMNCEVEAGFSIGVGLSYCAHLSTYTECRGEFAPVFRNVTGNYLETYYQTVNYSNPSVLGTTNHTYGYNYSGYLGASNSSLFTFSGYSTTNGTWKKGITLLLEPEVYIQTWTEVLGEGSGSTQGVVKANGPSDYARITGVTLS